MLPILVAYCVALLFVGVFASRSVRRAEDFFVAGRTLPPTLIFFTFLAANLGAGSTVGAAEFGYTSGLPAWWWVGSAGIGSVVLALVVGPRLHRVAKSRGLFTVGDYLESRYGRSTRLTVATVLLVGAPAILAGQIIAAGLVLQAAIGLPKALGTAIAATLATTYFAMGGLRSASWVNSLQVAVKAVGFLVAVPWMIRASGGWTELATAAVDNTALSIGGAGLGGTAQLVLLLAPAFIVSPGLVQKLFGAKDERAVRVGVGLHAGALLAYAILPVLLGMAARVHFPELADPGSALIKLFTEVAPFWLGALMLAAILSAEVSSADAVLFMIATSLSRDVLEPLYRGKLNDRARLALARYSAVAAGAVSIVLANWFQSILSALSFFYSLLTLTLFVPMLAGLFWKRPGQAVALAAIAASLGTAGLATLAGGAGEGWLAPVPIGILAGALVYAASAAISRRRGTP